MCGCVRGLGGWMYVQNSSWNMMRLKSPGNSKQSSLLETTLSILASVKYFEVLQGRKGVLMTVILCWGDTKYSYLRCEPGSTRGQSWW